jgi:Arc/MetJ-type ribon-helix-helix transcriptional regulator
MTEEKDEKKYTTISIPTPLAEKIKKRIEGTGFNSLSSYVTYVLREVISNIEEEHEHEEAFSKDDEEKVKDRLRALGYLD